MTAGTFFELISGVHRRYNVSPEEEEEKNTRAHVMALIALGNGLTDITGSSGGVTYRRDRSGLHISAKPRRVKQRTAAQNIQRNAFVAARRFSHDNRTVSYNIYRALNGLVPAAAPTDYYPDMR